MAYTSLNPVVVLSPQEGLLATELYCYLEQSQQLQQQATAGELSAKLGLPADSYTLKALTEEVVPQWNTDWPEAVSKWRKKVMRVAYNVP
jgi:hypothetical protein